MGEELVQNLLIDYQAQSLVCEGFGSSYSGMTFLSYSILCAIRI